MIFNTKIGLKYLAVAFLPLMIAACGGENKKTVDELGLDSLMGVPADSSAGLSEETMADIIQSIPSPVEMSSLIKATGNEYNSNLLNPTDNSSYYSTTNKKAFAIGVYGADLGYINIYEKTYSALNYLNVIKGLADDIKVGQFFDFTTLKRLAKSNDNVDSLLYISTSSFNNMDDYLRKQKRSNLSVLMASGAWLEGLYIATQVVKEKPNNELYERIGEQKPVLDNLLLILNVYKRDPYCVELIKGFELIQKEFQHVSITFEYKDAETKEVNGELVITDNNTSTVHITPEILRTITEAVEQVRNKAIGK